MSGTKMANDININVVAQVQGAIAPLKQVEQQVRRVGGQVERSTTAVTRNAMAYSRNGTNLRRWAKGALQQAGYQVGDFAVQVANGTNGIQAFGQQGSQLLGIFGPVGALLGAGVAIFSAFAVAANKAGGEVKNIASIFGVLEQPLRDTVNSIKELGQIFDGVFPAIVNNIDTAIIAAGLYAAVLGLKMIPRMIAAAGAGKIMTAALVQVRAAILASALSAGSFSTVMVALRSSALLLGGALRAVGAILMRFLPVAVLVGVAKLVEMILAAKNALGSFGAVFEIFKRIALEVLERVKMGFRLIGEEIYLATQRLLSFVGLASMTGEEMDAFRDSLNASWSGLGDGLASWEEFMAAVRAGTTEVQIFGDATDDALGEAGAAVEEMKSKVEALENSISKSMEDAFMSIVDGTASAKDAFKSMAKSIISELYRVIVVQNTVASIMGALGFGEGGTTRSVLSSLIGVRAQGGSVSANKPYIVGEKGPEMLVPSTSGRVIPNNQLDGGGSGQQVVINYSFQGGVTEADLGRALPLLVERTKREVVEAVQRGGSVARVFR
jgi:hypothetical protein